VPAASADDFDIHTWYWWLRKKNFRYLKGSWRSHWTGKRMLNAETFQALQAGRDNEFACVTLKQPGGSAKIGNRIWRHCCPGTS
jgi:hypothetical protein